MPGLDPASLPLFVFPYFKITKGYRFTRRINVIDAHILSS